MRETVTRILGRILRRKLPLAREVRADRNGIRTFIAAGDLRIKFRDRTRGRIDLKSASDRFLGVPVLDRECLSAKKFWLTRIGDWTNRQSPATSSTSLPRRAPWHQGARGRHAARGDRLRLAVRHYLDLVLGKFGADSRYASACARSRASKISVPCAKDLRS